MEARAKSPKRSSSTMISADVRGLVSGVNSTLDCGGEQVRCNPAVSVRKLAACLIWRLLMEQLSVRLEFSALAAAVAGGDGIEPGRR